MRARRAPISADQITTAVSNAVWNGYPRLGRLHVVILEGLRRPIDRSPKTTRFRRPAVLVISGASPNTTGIDITPATQQAISVSRRQPVVARHS